MGKSRGSALSDLKKNKSQGSKKAKYPEPAFTTDKFGPVRGYRNPQF